MMAGLLILSRQIHRMAMWATIVFSVVVGVTGTMLKLGIGDFRIREIHSDLSLFLSLSLGVMVATGLLMYLSPTLVRLAKKD
jgi:hypothetical protein